MKLSVIIPCYNCEKYIKGCLDSVFEALHPDDEVICVDDGSTDGTLELLRSISAPNLRVITQSNKGPGAARNTGIEAASGEQILFVDSDDEIYPSLIETVKSQPEGSLGSRQICMKMARGSKKPDIKSQNDAKSQMVLPSKEVKLDLLNADRQSSKKILKSNYDIYGPCVKTYSKEILEKFHIRFTDDLKWGEDISFNLRYICHIEEVSFVPVTAYWYRKTPGSLTNHFSPENSHQIQYFLETVSSILKDEDKTVCHTFYYMVLKQYIYILQYDFCNKFNPEPFIERKKKALQLLDENELIHEGIRRCFDMNINVSMGIVLFLIRVKCFAAVDLILKFYTKIK